ncbi:MAG: hypothetical protein C0591_13195 [Marinilabiliales bacterium]|jgi:hypothetical protein|nr:MAG: hypothetical protein C0591_13195 [Marinilabiliales bacterium]
MKKQFLILSFILTALLAKSQWTKSFTLDDFGDTTDMVEITGKSFDGLIYYNDPNGNPMDKFCTRVYIDKDQNVGLFLYENCVFEKPAFPGTDALKEVTFRMRNSEGTTEKVTILDKWSKSGGLKLENKKFIDFLKSSNGEIRCIVQSGVAYYKFTIDASGYHQLIGK